MEIKVVKCVLSSPIERVRGGKIVISVNSTFLVENSTYEFSGSVCLDDAESFDLSSAFKAAFNDSLNNLNVITGLKIGAGIPMESFKKLLDPTKKVLGETLLENKGSKALELAVTNRPDEKKQAQIKVACDALGIENIDVMNGAWTILEAQALLTVLESIAKPLEVK